MNDKLEVSDLDPDAQEHLARTYLADLAQFGLAGVVIAAAGIAAKLVIDSKVGQKVIGQQYVIAKNCTRVFFDDGSTILTSVTDGPFIEGLPQAPMGRPDTSLGGNVALFQINQNMKEGTMGDEPSSSEMPRYKSHKEVHALKIAGIVFDREEANLEGRETDGGAIIIPSEDGYAPFKVDKAYVDKHEPKAGGYYVVYADGYKSWSPAEAFEDGYTLVE